MSDAPIRPLTDALINQIAAGEVVERPVSIVKELVENSLDAGATQVRIEVEEGGIRRLLVRDNGRGIPRDELPLALQRHCTSKLRDADQLTRLGTLGFRGEALAAIAAVGDLTLSSRRDGAETAWQLTNDEASAPVPVAHPRGTSVEVRQLFGRVPARRRFLRQAQTEWLHVLSLVRRMAFCNPLVDFRLLNDGQQALHAPASLDQPSLERRLRALFGAEFVAAARWVELAAGQLRVCGYVAEASAARSQPDLQVFAVNGRVVRDRQLSHAVRLGFEDRLPAGRYPCFALQVDLPMSEVDVNVHPGKWEVRFRDLRAVHDLIYSSIKQSVTEISSGRFYTLRDAPQRPWTALAPAQPLELQRALYAPETAAKQPTNLPLTSITKPVAGPSTGGAPVRWLGLMVGRFGLLKDESSLRVVDIRGLAREVLSQRLAAARPWAVKPVLFPVRIECPDQPTAEALTRALEGLGLEIEALAPDTLALSALPVQAPDCDPAALGAALANLRPDAGVGGFAAALATAMRVPPEAGDEGARWWVRWQSLATEAGIDTDPWRRSLDEAALHALFDPGPDGSA